MSDYTPTTEEVREGYSTHTYDDAKAELEFDRWLAEVKAQAWEEGWLSNVDDRTWPSLDDNPYREEEQE